VWRNGRIAIVVTAQQQLGVSGDLGDMHLLVLFAGC
jgi:hypothetical protein